MSGNELGDSVISTLLKSPDCKLQKLQLNNSSITEEGCKALASALGSNPSHLKELNLSGNKLGDSGVKHISALLEKPDFKLEKLLLNDSSTAEEGCAHLTKALTSNPSHLIELDLSGNKLGDSGVKHISALLENPDCKLQKLLLSNSNITKEDCAALTSALTSNPSQLIELNLSGNNLGDSGVKHIVALLDNQMCKLQKLRLSNCSITAEGYAALASALKSNPSHLVELDLRGNDPGDSAVELLTDLHHLLNDKKCKLKTLRLLKSDAAQEACDYLTSILGTSPLLLTELDLSEKNPGDSGVLQFCALLEDSHCRLQKLKLDDSSITDVGCSALSSALTSNPSHLIELNLSGNELKDSGVKHISVLLGNPDCKLQKLLLSDCCITEEGYAALATYLKSNPSHLVELDLRGNDPGDSGVELLTDFVNLVKDSKCKLKTLRLLKSDAAKKACSFLIKDHGINPLCKKELDLSGKKLGDSVVKLLSAVLEDSHCKLQKLKLAGCGIRGEGYAALATALKSKNSQLTELDLRGNDPGESAVKLLTDLYNLVNDQKHKLKTLRLLKSDAAEKSCEYLTSHLRKNPLLLAELDLSRKKLEDVRVQQFCALLEDSHCKLKKLKLNNSSITEEDCAALTSALKSNPSHLIELNLSGNLGDSGVTHICDLLQNPKCKLQKLLLNESSITDAGCAALASALKSNPSQLIELNLSGNKLGDSGVKHICDLLQNPMCKLQKLLLNNSSITKEGCAALASALKSNPSHLIELHLNGNKLGDSGVKLVSALLKKGALKKLLLSNCGVTGEGYSSLVFALKSEHSNLIELDLSGNDPGHRRVKLLTDLVNLVNDEKCQLQTLKLLKSDAAEKACAYLTSVVDTNPLLLTELDLRGKNPGDSGVKQFCALLGDSICKLQRLRLNDSKITDVGCAALASALSSNPSHLIELDLSGNKLGDSAVKHISALLKNPDCKLQKLLLNDSDITEKGCAALTSALISNPSHLIELNLSGNKLGNSGLKHISALLRNPDCKLQKLLLIDSTRIDKGHDALTSTVTSDTSLDLRESKQNDSGVKQTCALLEDPNFKHQKGKSLNEHCGCSPEGMKKRNLKKTVHEDLFLTFTELKQNVTIFLDNEWKRFKKLLKKEKIKYYEMGVDENYNAREAALSMTLHFLRKMNKNDLADTLENGPIEMCQRELKSNLKKRYECVFEGIAKQGESKLLEKIFTDLYITEGGSGTVNKEHEVRQIERKSGISETQEKLIECNSIFKSLPEQDRPIRTVLTKGVAGIGKSISVQKFILDWLKGLANEDIDLIFPLPFRELNLKVQKCSFMDILHQFFPETKGLMFTKNKAYKVLFVFDGLDECRHPLAFKKNEIWSDLTTPTSVDVLLTNLIKGNLFPSALIWITTRPAAAGCIPPDCIDQVAEIRGFNDEQKEEYFRKKITDGLLADKVIKHMKESRSLYIMCHIPVFCWISATVLERKLEERKEPSEAQEETESSDKEQTLKTLTQMYSHFLIFQTRRSTEKYGEKYVYDTEWDEKGMLTLGQLAFQNLLKNNLIFLETDLTDCGISVDDASVYSGVCTQIFKQDSGVFLGTAFCFVHLSIQEFFAALYTFMSFNKQQTNVFGSQDMNESCTVTDLLKSAVDKALDSDSGHLDLFLRFLLGLSLESNQELLKGLLTETGNSSQGNEEIVKYIKEKLQESPSAERSINLFYCLNELNDKSLVKEIQDHLSSGSLSSAKLSPAQWSALVFVLMTSEERIEVFDLKKYIRSDECLMRLLPVVKTATTALLDECNLTQKSCSVLATILSSSSSNLKELNLSKNKIEDAGVQDLAKQLENPQCKLETLRLSDCSITGEGYAALASALKSNTSHLIKLDLSGNDPGDSGVKRLTDLQTGAERKLQISFLKSTDAEKACADLKKVVDNGINPLLLKELDLSQEKFKNLNMMEFFALLEDSHCRLQKLKLTPTASETVERFAAALKSNSSHMKELDLSGNELGDSGVKHISDLLQIPSCKLEKLKLDNSNITDKGIADLASTLGQNLKDLDLSGNNLGDTGVEHISAQLKSEQCKLKRLVLSNCDINENGYTNLASAIKSNPSHLIELDLRRNNPGDSGVKLLLDLLQVSGCKLERLRLLNSDAAEKACDELTSVLGINPLVLKELDLSKHAQGDSGVEQLSALLKDSQCTLTGLKLNNSSITEKGCAALASALGSNPSHLIELNLSGNKIGDLGIDCISTLLNKSSCKVQTLILSNCNITGKGYVALASALKSNHSHLVKLDLRGNDPGDSGVELLTKLISDKKLQTLQLLKTEAAEEAFKYLNEVLGTNPLLLTDLDLNGKKLEDLPLQQFSDLLEDSHCKLKMLKLSDCGLTETICSALATVFRSEQRVCTLRELDLSNNKIQDSGMELLSEGLRNTHCKLEKLNVKCCSLTEKSCSALVPILSSDSSSLIQLDLSGNSLLDSGVTQLSNGLKNLKCKVQILRLGNTTIKQKGCEALASALRLNPSHLIELNLSGNKLENAGAEHIFALLENQYCKLERLLLSDCSITCDGYAALTKAVKSEPLHLTELDLRGNDPGHSGVKLMKSIVGFVKGKVRILNSVAAEEACDYLGRVLGENPLFLTELDFSTKKLSDSDVKHISTLLEDSNCKVDTLKLNDCGLTEQNCSVLVKILSSESSNVTHLDMSHNTLGDPGVKLLSDGLNSPHCKLEMLSLSKSSMTAECCAALASALKSNPSHLMKLNLSGNKLEDLGVKQISALLDDQHCKLQELGLSDCSITGEGYAALASALKSNPSHLVELDLRGNNPGDSGVDLLTDLYNLVNDSKLRTLRLLKSKDAEEVFAYLTSVGINPLLQMELDLSGKQLGDSRVKQLSALLTDSHCRLQKLKLSDCSITGKGYAALASALNSNPSHLVELDLRGNNPGSIGVTQLTDLYDLLKGPNPKLKTLRLLKTDAAEKAFAHLKSVLGTNPLLQTELDLSGKIPGNSEVKQFSALLEDSQCRLQKLKLNNSSITDEGCAYLTSALKSNPTHLIELNLSGNELGDSGVNHIAALLRNTDCKLRKLELSDCSITGEGYVALASALKSNPSHLVELDLRGNDPGDTGVKLIIDINKDPACKLKTIRFLKADDAEKVCNKLNGVLGTNPLLLTELDLSGKLQKVSGLQQFCALLKDSHCRLKKLILNNNNITDEGCAHLTTALTSNPSHLIELSLSGNTITDIGVNFISALLRNPDCKLEKLELNNCNITHEGSAALTSALLANPSLKELNLSGNEIKDQGVKHISALLGYQHCKLEKLVLNDCNMTHEGCAELTSALKSNPSHLVELNLSGNTLGHSGVKHVSALLENPDCKLQKLELNNNNIAKEGCAALRDALLSNPSHHLIELSLSKNKLGDTSAKYISALLTDSRCKLEKLLLNNNHIAEEGCAALASALTLNVSHLRELHLKGNKLGDSVKKISALVKDPNYKLQNLILDEGFWKKWFG